MAVPKDIASFREMVPVASKAIYLNSSFQPPMNKVVYDSIRNFIDESYYSVNPKAEFIAKCEETRKKVASFLNTEPENIAFTRDTTEGVNIFQRSIKWSKGDNVVILENEHPNQGFGWLGLVNEGLEVRLVKTDESELKPFNADDFAPFVDENTKAIGLSSVMFHSGLRNDVRDLVKRFKSKGIHILVDATQEVGFGKIDVKDMGASAIAFGVHKGLSIPTGLGILYVETETMKDLKEVPPILCGGSISNMNSDLTVKTDFEVFSTALRFEHLNKAMLQCIALASYVDCIEDIGIENVQSYLESLGSYLRSKLRVIGIETAGPDDARLRSPQSNVVPLFGPKWAEHFISNDVYVSQYRCGTRISLGLYNNKADIDSFVEVVNQGLVNGLQPLEFS
jgi:selenocysteine lyase/cysteine desulfurase